MTPPLRGAANSALRSCISSSTSASTSSTTAAFAASRAVLSTSSTSSSRARRHLSSSSKTAAAQGSDDHGHGSADHGHESHYDPPTGWLWGQDPKLKHEKEPWENIWYWGFYGSLIAAGVAYAYKPDTSIETWALEEAKRRLQADGTLPEDE